MTKLAVVVGPTASGKTALSVACAHVLGAEIVSADSVAIYKGMVIGSACPTMEERQGVPHHLIGEIDPRTAFSAANFQTSARERIAQIEQRGALPMLVGGTGLYINAVVNTLDFTEARTDEAFRKLWQEREEQEKGAAHRRLQQVDPASAQRLHPNDIKRVIRALEVYELTGIPMSAQNSNFNREESVYDLCMIGLTMPRERLYERIELRVDMMLEQGLVEEVQALLHAGIDPQLASMQGLGYKEIVWYLQGKCSLADAAAKIKLETRHFAKRQMTWFNRDSRITWFDTTEEGVTEQVVQHITKALV